MIRQRSATFCRQPASTNVAHLAANLRAHRVAAHLARFGCVAAVSTLVGVATAGGNVGRCAAGGALLAIGVAWTLCCGQPFAGLPAWRPCANVAHLAANLRAHRVAAHLARFGCVAAVSTLVGVATAGGNVETAAT